MPFDVLPQEIGTGKFKKFADAILAGCQKSIVQCRGSFFLADASCALGAMALGLGFNPADSDDVDHDIEHLLPDELCRAYMVRYGNTIPHDNDYGFSREQIAARIAAL